jgi:hypothetical protein
MHLSRIQCFDCVQYRQFYGTSVAAEVSSCGEKAKKPIVIGIDRV